MEGKKAIWASLLLFLDQPLNEIFSLPPLKVIFLQPLVLWFNGYYKNDFT